jgi:chromosome segregation ATPase
MTEVGVYENDHQACKPLITETGERILTMNTLTAGAVRMRDNERLQKQINELRETLAQLSKANSDLNEQLASTKLKKSQELLACNDKVQKIESKMQKYKKLEVELENDKEELQNVHEDRKFPVQEKQLYFCHHLTTLEQKSNCTNGLIVRPEY